MRLHNIYLACRKNRPILENIPTRDITKANGSRVIELSNWQRVFAGVTELQEIPYFEEICGELLDRIPQYFLFRDSFELDFSVGRDVMRICRELLTKMTNVMELYESMDLDAPGDCTFDVQLPDCGNITDFKRAIGELEYVLTKCPYLRLDEGSLRVQSFDVGSFWLVLSIIGGATLGSIFLNNLVALYDKTLVVRSHKATYEEQKRKLAQSSETAEHKKIIEQYLTNLYEEQVKQALKELEQETEVSLRNDEEMSLAKNTFDKMSHLIENGLKIQAALDAPEEVKALFEPLEMKYLELSPKKLLEKKEE